MRRYLHPLALLSALLIVLTACSSATDDTEGPAATAAPDGASSAELMEGVGGLPLVDPLEITGDIVAAGSSTVFPLAEAMLARFEDEGYGGNMTIDSIGSGGGFERFCEAGETDISNASRPIKESEVEACESIGRTPIEIRIGTDALAVTVSPTNYFVESLTLEELALAFSSAETWADVNPDFPAHPIARFSPGTDSGIGIAASDQERVFERFFRVDSARSRATGGTGLGLSIVRHVMHHHGGWAEVDSVSGHGSTFRLHFPL